MLCQLFAKSKAMGGSTLSNSQLTPGVVPGRLPADAYADHFADKEPPFDRHEAQVAAGLEGTRNFIADVFAENPEPRCPCVLVEPRAWQKMAGIVGKGKEQREKEQGQG